MDASQNPAQLSAMENAFSVSRNKAYLVLAVLLFLNIFNYMDRYIINMALEAIKADFKLTDTEVGLLQSIFLVGVGVLIYPAGILIDRWSRKHAVALMAILWSMATILTGWSGSLVLLFFARFWCGSGEAGFQPGGTAWLSVVFPKKNRSTVTGLFLSGGILGIMIGMSLGGYLINAHSWRMPFIVFGAAGVLLGGLSLILPDIKTKQIGARPSLMKETRELFSNKTFVFISLAQGFFMAHAMAGQGWGIALLLRAYSMSETEVGIYLALTVIPAILSPALGGVIADKLHKKMPTKGRALFTVLGSIMAFVCSTVGLLLIGNVPFIWYFIWMLVSSCLGCLHVVTWQVINMDIFKVNQRGKAAAMTGLVSFLIFSWWGATLIGWLSDVWGSGVEGLRWAMLVLQPALLATVWFSYKSMKTYAADVVLEENAD